MAANSEEEIEQNIEGEIIETTSPIAPRSLHLKDKITTEEDDHIDEIVDEEEDEEKDPLLELKKCKEWLLQQKINHESELLVRKLSLSSSSSFFYRDLAFQCVFYCLRNCKYRCGFRLITLQGLNCRIPCHLFASHRNNKSAYCVMPRSTKHSHTCK